MNTVQTQKEHLANLLTAIQHSVFLLATDHKLVWPLDANEPECCKKAQCYISRRWHSSEEPIISFKVDIVTTPQVKGEFGERVIRKSHPLDVRFKA